LVPVKPVLAVGGIKESEIGIVVPFGEVGLYEGSIVIKVFKFPVKMFSKIVEAKMRGTAGRYILFVFFGSVDFNNMRHVGF